MSHLRLAFPIEDFDALPAAPPVVAAPAPGGCGCARCRNDAALPECRADAWEDGHRAGLAARASIAAAEAAALAAALDAALAGADAVVGGIAEATAEAVGRAVIALAAAALPGTFAALGAAEARRVALAVLPALEHEPAVSITAGTEAARLLDGLATPRITVIADPQAGPADIRLAWRNGRSERSAAAALARIGAVLAELGLLPDPAPAPAPALEEPAHG
jgi:hypothetical protein